jgi:hypothetical protein
MGWSIKTNNKNKWSLFSSVTDSNIATFETQKELVKFIATEQIYKGKLQAIETLMTFPYGRNINDKRSIEGNRDIYYRWHESILSFETYEEYYGAIGNKLKELMATK